MFLRILILQLHLILIWGFAISEGYAARICRMLSVEILLDESK